jgi:hypothetical protein
MIRPYLAFDIEIAKAFPSGQSDWKAYRPLGITCAATFYGEGEPRRWHGQNSAGQIAPQMSRREAVELVEYLQSRVASGLTLLTWNGLGFDLDVLAEESGLHTSCSAPALDHVDMMFHIFCRLGYPLGLNKAARGMQVPGKPTGMSGALAPRYWAEGKWALVLDYVAQDARTTLALARAVEEQGELRWTSERGVRQTISFPEGWLTVRQALVLSEPDTSWMSRPIPRSRFLQWLNVPSKDK